MSRLLIPFAISIGLTFATTAAVFADDPVQRHNFNSLWFENWVGLTNATLVVQAPDGTITETYSETASPSFRLSGSGAIDGVYRYELRAMSKNKPGSANQGNLGQGSSDARSYDRTGSFVVERRAIITPEVVEELTLYALEQQDVIAAQATAISALSARLAAIEN